MKKISNEQIVFFDVDNTLVIWTNKYHKPHSKAVKFIDPYDNSVNYLKPHRKHIDLLKKYKGRKNYVIVWSHGGVKWAESVIKKLAIDKYVDMVMTKPLKYIDDLGADEILGTRVFLKDE